MGHVGADPAGAQPEGHPDQGSPSKTGPGVEEDVEQRVHGRHGQRDVDHGMGGGERREERAEALGQGLGEADEGIEVGGPHQHCEGGA